MRKNIFALLATLAATVFALPAHSETLELTASEWPPYVDPTTRANGFAIALVSSALERAGYGLKFTAETWPTALEATVAGKYDVVGAIWFRDERGESTIMRTAGRPLTRRESKSPPGGLLPRTSPSCATVKSTWSSLTGVLLCFTLTKARGRSCSTFCRTHS
jgi:ABC-type amino acid transport substrate-binding protein